jgi:hypothetical protein
MSLKRFFPLLYKIFFIGLILQFVLQTFVTYQLWLEWWVWSAIWLWKEILILVLGWWMVIDLTIHKQRKNLLNTQRVQIFLWLFVSCLGVAWIAHFVWVWSWISEFIIAFKYDFFGFVILLVWLGASRRLTPDQKDKLINWSIEVFKRTLLLSIIWYLVVAVKPWVLKLLGFNPFSYEWVVGASPPAMYYTHINQWLPRNSFLFERPTTRWFFLVALRPLLYLKQLRTRSLETSRIRRGIMGVNILITFSRAAWWSWIIITLLCIAFTTTDLKKILIKFALPLIIGFAWIGYLWYQQIFARTYSNTGHVAMLVQAAEMIQESPRVWRWWATAGPWSHQTGVWFNPENQFLQLRVEFGIGWFILRWLLFWSVIRLWRRYRDEPVLVAISLWMLGLAISGMVLHSFADRMVVYPRMILVWVVISSQISSME